MHIVEDNKNIKDIMKNKIVAISAGGTGGHIFPALSIAKLLINDGYYVLFFTDSKFFNYIKDNDPIFHCGLFEVIELSARNASRIKQVFMIFKDFIKCRKILIKRVKLCIGFGGFVSFTPVLMSILTFKKTIIHEQNAVIGLANKLLLPFVKKCLLTFDPTIGINHFFKKKCIIVGNPIRNEIKKLVYNYDNPSINYRAFYKIEENINLSIIGGSQACKVFDILLPEAISMLPNSIISKLHVIHQCKYSDIDRLEQFYTDRLISHEVKPFFYNIGEILRSSHLIIARAGSTSIAEICALGTPSILIPLPNATNNHQYYNAKILRDNNGAMLLDQNLITASRLSQVILNLFNNDVCLYELSQGCRKLAKINADITIFNIINNMLGNQIFIEKKESMTDITNIKYINDNVGLG